MKSFTFDALPGRVVFGVGSIGELPAEIERMGLRGVLVVSDPATKVYADEVIESLGDAFAGLFTDIELHVPIEAVERARAAAATTSADAVLTVGGGSTTGFGKAIALVTGIPTVAVPTTYAGSEMTPIYGITSDGVKRTGRDPRVLPKLVVYDPALTTSLPPAITASSGMNALAHCVEAMYARNANPITSLMAEESIRALVRGVAGAVRDPDDLEARSDALYGAYLAGAALAVVGMALHHRICHVLGGTYGLAHGEVNAVVLPHVACFNQPAAPEAIARAASAMGTSDLPGALFDFARSLGAPTSLAELGMHHEDLAEAARLSMDSPPSWNPRPYAYADVLGLLEDAYEGRRPASRVGVLEGR